MTEDQTTNRKMSAKVTIFGTLRILAATFVLSKAASLALDPGFAGQNPDVAFALALTITGFALLFGWVPVRETKSRRPKQAVKRIEPTIVADPIMRNVFAPLPIDAQDEVHTDGCDVTNIFADPKKSVTLNAVVA